MYVWLLKTSITTRCRIEGVRTNRRARRRAWEAEACTETPVKILLEKVKMLTHYWGREIKVSIRGITCKQATSFHASPLWKSCWHPRGLLFRNSWPPTVLPFSKPSWILTERRRCTEYSFGKPVSVVLWDSTTVGVSKAEVCTHKQNTPWQGKLYFCEHRSWLCCSNKGTCGPWY